MSETQKAVLIVDLDNTLLKNDFFAEALIKQLISNPFDLVYQYLKHKNWVSFKQQILSNTKPTYVEIKHLVNTNVYVWITENKHNFSSIHIVSASPNQFVNYIFEIIKSNFADNPIVDAKGSIQFNLSGIKKFYYILENYGENFWYIGDSKSDNFIFARSKGALIVINGHLKKIHGELY
jgi:hypothetical protein